MKKNTRLLPARALMIALMSAGGLVVAGCASTETRQAPGEYMDDAVITTKVKTAFATDDQVSALAINVETFRGTVQLSGFAKTQAEINRAVELARGVEGVQNVRNDIRLKTEP